MYEENNFNNADNGENNYGTGTNPGQPEQGSAPQPSDGAQREVNFTMSQQNSGGQEEAGGVNFVMPEPKTSETNYSATQHQETSAAGYSSPQPQNTSGTNYSSVQPQNTSETNNAAGAGQTASGADTSGTNYSYQQSQSTSGTNHSAYSRPENDIPKWEPQKNYSTNTVVTKPEKTKKRWLVPLIIIIVVMVAAIGVGGFFLFRELKEKVSISIDTDDGTYTEEPSDQEDESSYTQVETTQTNTSENAASSASSGYILTDVSAIVEQAMPSVVSITKKTLVENNGYNDIWNYFFGNGGQGGISSSGSSSSEEVASGLGSGTIVGQNDTELLILTSYHVVEDCSSLYVTFSDDSAVDGYIKASSEESDIAIVALKLSDISQDTLSKIKVATLSTEEVTVGEGVIVIGNALGYGQSVVTGIVSAVDRTISKDGYAINVLQTDAAINSGNSGGCMLNSKGEIIGISEAKITSSSVEGICYAISVMNYYDTIQNLMNTETEAEEESTEQTQTGSGAYLGIYGQDVSTEQAQKYDMYEGVYVYSTVSGSGAEEAGLEQGDIIVAVDGTNISTMEELQNELATHSAGDTVSLTIMRKENGKYSKMTVDVQLTGALS